MSLTVGEANDVQRLAAWFAALTCWDLSTSDGLDDQGADEREMAAGFVRLAERSRARLGVGMGREELTDSPALAWMLDPTRAALAPAVQRATRRREDTRSALLAQHTDLIVEAGTMPGVYGDRVQREATLLHFLRGLLGAAVDGPRNSDAELAAVVRGVLDALVQVHDREVAR